MSSIAFEDCAARDYFYDCCENNTSEGRIDGIAWVKKGVWGGNIFDVTTINDDTVWQGIVAANLGFIIQNVRGQYDGSTASETAGYGRQISRLSGRTHQIVYNHLFTWTGNSNVSGGGLNLLEHNVDFYSWLNRQNNYELFFTTQYHIWRIGNPAMSFTQLPISEAIENNIEYVVTVKWASGDLPTPYLRCSNNICLNVFDNCDYLNPDSLCWNPNTLVASNNCS